MVTSSLDRRHRIQQYPVPLVKRAINESVYGDDNRRIMTDLFLDNFTYEAAAADANISVRGLYKRVDAISPRFESYLKQLN